MWQAQRSVPRSTIGWADGGLRGWRWLAIGVMLVFVWMRLLSPHGGAAGPLVWLPCLALLAALRFVWLNRRRRGLWLLTLGALLNLAVMASNGGLMPIAPATYQALVSDAAPAQHVGVALGHSKDRVFTDAQARLALLDDRLVFQVGNRHIAASAGDLLILIGVLLTLVEEIIRPMGQRREPAPESGLGAQSGQTPFSPVA